MSATTLLRRLTRRCRACGHRISDHKWRAYALRGPCHHCDCKGVGR